LDFNTRIFQGDFIVFGYKMVEKPNFSASWMRWSTRFTGRISQTSPLLLQKTKPLSTGMSSLEDKMAATTARSIAGSSTLMPGYVEENVFAKPETGFSRTAKIIFSLLAL
jgi:hypothetical protein